MVARKKSFSRTVAQKKNYTKILLKNVLFAFQIMLGHEMLAQGLPCFPEYQPYQSF
jgi:hypothetical protein